MDQRLKSADWDTLRAVLAVKRNQSFRAASQELSISTPTITRAIDRLEDILGFPLFKREADGAKLTEEGRRLAKSIEDAERSVFDVWELATQSRNTSEGWVRIAVTEGLGTFWIMSPLSNYIIENPNVQIELQAAMKSVDVLRFESDISIQFTEPSRSDLHVEQLGWLHLTWFASEEYVARKGICSSYTDLPNHHIVEQETDQLKSYGLDTLFGPGSTKRMVRLRTNFSSAHYWAVAKGVGIGLLPNYANLVGARVVHMPFAWSFPVKVFMAVHPEMVGKARHRKTMNWLRSAFAAEHYPWFGKDYIEPSELRKLPVAAEMIEYFRGFVPGVETMTPLLLSGSDDNPR